MKFKQRCSLIAEHGLRLFVALVLVGESIAGAAPSGQLRVDQNGVIGRNGEPCRAIGVNYFDAFSRLLHDPDDRTYLEGLTVLSRAHVPFIRFSVSGFWPDDFRVYAENPSAFFRPLDEFVRAAEDKSIGLVPSLFWNRATVPDLLGESVSAWGDPSSKTVAFMRKFTRSVVERYRESPAIWAWEFGNEMNLYVDLPNATRHRPKINVSKGTPNGRSSADDLTIEDATNAWTAFAATVREIDPYRPLSLGGSLPRPYAYNNMKKGSWTIDTRDEFRAALAEHNPVAASLLSVHVYPVHAGKYFRGENATILEILREVKRTAAQRKQAVFVGEFGASEDLGHDAARERFVELLSAIEQSGVALAAVWVFDFQHQGATYDIRPGGRRQYQLELISDANLRLANDGRLC